MKLLIDTGPLVAIISKDDAGHAACVKKFETLDEPPLTCWLVIAEAAWLLRHNLEHVQTLLDFGAEQVIELVDIEVSEFSVWLSRFFSTYEDQQPQLADSALMFLADKLDVDTIFTLDRRDFSIFRKSSGQALTILP